MAAQAPSAEALAFFEGQIRPIFVDTCSECHGSDKQESNLRLDSSSAFSQGGDSGPLINRDNLSASLLISVVEYQGEIKMPENMRLPDEDIAAIRQWVMLGAPWPQEAHSAASSDPGDSFSVFLEKSRATHWAFKPFVNPGPPEVSRPDWLRTPVDGFIMARLDEAGLAPSARADRRTLIRRLSFDLTGLPPTMEEVEAFAADRRPDAYKRVVERLLASPQYGERWGRHWLDVARYADTKGYVFEEDRFFPYSYTYRDYVIRAFNEDLPYDRFILEQLAADRLDLGEDVRPLAALGFLTLGRRFLNNIHDIIDDQIDVVSRGLLGLTVSCARCHDHKFDPIEASDYYALYGVFRSAHTPNELPLIADPDPDDPKYQEFLTLLAQKKKDLAEYEHKIHSDLLIEVRNEMGAYVVAAHDARTLENETAFKTLAKERGIRHEILQKWVDFLESKLEAPDAIYRPYAWFSELPEETFAEGVATVLERILADESINARVRAAFDGNSPASMAQVLDRYVGLLESVDSEWRDLLSAHVQMDAHTPDDARPYPSVLPDSAAEALRQIMYGKDAPGNVPPGAVYAISDTQFQQKVREKQRAVARHEATHAGRPDRAMALNDTQELFDPYIFQRGKADNRGDAVQRRFIQLLCEDEPGPFTKGGGRLDLARAIGNPENPLTARVFVNRVWLHHFGRGLVDTPSDFGLRSDPPSHPELLDYLARRFVDDGWSVKELHRVIILSNTYRQSSDTNESGVENDVENRLLWRQNRRRLDFESMRDALLVASGELDLTMGGPPQSMTKEPLTKRRAVYGLVERQNMAGFIKAFDFASPDAHSPKRFNTIVPQQSLYLMNSPFVIERARAMARRSEDEAEPGTEARIRRLFEIGLQRAPDPGELKQIAAFVAREDFDDGPPPPPPSEWRYGFASYDAESQRVDSFVALDTYEDGRWQPRDEFPHPELGHISVHRNGGHPGRDQEHSAVHRWVAPRDGVVSVAGTLKHPSDRGDGVTGHVVSSRHGLLADASVLSSEQEIEIEGVEVIEGDTIDVVVSPGPTDAYDGYEWTQTIRMDRPEDSVGESVRTKWNSRTDFSGPPPEPPDPLSPWGQVAQVLLLTNEFMYID